MTLIYPHAYFAYRILILGYVEIDCYINDKTTKTVCSSSHNYGSDRAYNTAAKRVVQLHGFNLLY